MLRQRLDKLSFLVFEMGEERPAQRLDRGFDPLEVSRLVHVLDELRVDGFDRVVDLQVLLGEPGRAREPATRRFGVGGGRFPGPPGDGGG